MSRNVHHHRGKLRYAFADTGKKSDAPSGIGTHNTPISWQVNKEFTSLGARSF